MSAYEVRPARQPLEAVVQVPGSVVLAHRAMIAAALADGTSRLSNVPLGNDTRCMIDALRSLGVAG